MLKTQTNSTLNKLLILIALTMPFSCMAQSTVIGAGSSFVYPLLSHWSSTYKTKTQQEINYQSIGSGGGLQQLTNQTVDFAAVDMPQTAATLDKNHWIQFPIAIGGIVIIANIPGVKNNQLRLTGPVLADIFLGKITKWNNAAIKSLNPSLPLPNLSITVVHRADGSGTTYNFTHYLNQVSHSWKAKVGAATEVSWPTGIGGKGTSGVAMFTQRIPGSIGYVEYSFAKLTNLNTLALKNKAGNFVEPNPHSFSLAANNANWKGANHYQLLLINQPGAESWPIMATTFALLPIQKNYLKQDKRIISFFKWGFINGTAAIKSLDYVALPNSTIKLILHDWNRIDKEQGAQS